MLAVRDDIRHRRVVAGKPIGRAEAVGDLLLRKGERAALDVLLSDVVGRSAAASTRGGLLPGFGGVVKP